MRNILKHLRIHLLGYMRRYKKINEKDLPKCPGKKNHKMWLR